jgi:hypothetical protein
MFWLGLLVGFLAGGFVGIVLMCVVSIAKKEAPRED